MIMTYKSYKILGLNLLQRFYNETSLKLTDVEFDLVELDINGRVIQRRTFSYHNLSILPEKYFSIPEGIVVSSDCVDFKIARFSIASGRYVYRTKRGKIQTYYDRRNADSEKERFSFAKSRLKVESYTPRFKMLYGATAALALLLSIACCLYLLFLQF